MLLTLPQAKELISRIGYRKDTDPEFCEAFIEKLDGLYYDYDKYVGNALLLSIMLLTFSETGGILSGKMHRFFEEAYDALSSRHDTVHKTGFRRTFFTGLTPKALKQVIGEFCSCGYNDWNYWINDENSITVKIDYLVEKSIVYQLPAMMTMNGPDYNMVYALGLFFLQLLVKEKSLPWIMNRPEYGFEWMSVLDDLIHKGSVSSLTSRIVTSCLSVRNRENRILRQDTGADLNDLYWGDNPKIWDVDDLLEQLKKDLELLKTNLVSVANSQQRQVIVIDLE